MTPFGERRSNERDAGLEAFLVDVEAGTEVFKEGEEGSELYLIEEGQVAILRGADGRRLAVLEKGDYFGEMALLERLPRSATARALSRCRLLKLDARTFDLLLRTAPEIAVLMMRKLSWRLRAVLELPQAPPIAATVVTGIPVPPARGRLCHRDSGEVFDLERPETLIGRPDPDSGHRPDIDLTSLDPLRSTSRRHAKLVRREGGFFLVALSRGASGTVVDGHSLEPDAEIELKPRAELQFGLVRLSFERE